MLPDFIQRCSDNGCPDRELCLRWLERDTSSTPCVVSLFPLSQPLDQPCPNLMTREDAELRAGAWAKREAKP